MNTESVDREQINIQLLVKVFGCVRVKTHTEFSLVAIGLEPL